VYRERGPAAHLKHVANEGVLPDDKFLALTGMCKKVVVIKQIAEQTNCSGKSKADE